ncbi:hypothetical protein K8R04_04285 [Candidatus Uhrbacteria bacterium]|nr:hypothetical protein [Candidatus Uhrbacteria bacterium]
MKMSANKRSDQLTDRKAALGRLTARYIGVITKLHEHPVFKFVNLRPVDFKLSDSAEHRLAQMSDDEFEDLYMNHGIAVMDACRALRCESLRRAWQSAYDRRITRLGFLEYLTQEGFLLLCIP